MFTDTEFKDFIIKHRAEILKNDWESIYDDLPSYKDVSSLTDFLLNKANINPLYYMTSVPTHFAYNLDITSINIPNNITSIGEWAFSNCSSLTSITIPNSVTEIGGDAFYNCIRLTSINIPDGVRSIEEYAFAGCNKLTSITIPNSVESINDFAFEDCTGLTSITIPNSVTSIRSSTFLGCDNLKEIKYTGNQQQWNKLLVTNEGFANWIHENKVKVNLL